MSKDQNKDRQTENSRQRDEDDSGLQEELDREATEGRDSVGDVGSNRNLSGSSTWETLPDKKKTRGET